MSVVDQINAAAAELGWDPNREVSEREAAVDKARGHYNQVRGPWPYRRSHGFFLSLTMAELVVALKDGPIAADALLSGELFEKTHRSLPARTLYRAKRALRVQSFQRGRAWYWRLPHESLYRKALTLPESARGPDLATCAASLTVPKATHASDLATCVGLRTEQYDGGGIA